MLSIGLRTYRITIVLLRGTKAIRSVGADGKMQYQADEIESQN